MAPGPTAPCSLAALLAEFRPCFAAPTFHAFVGLVLVLISQTRRARTAHASSPRLVSEVVDDLTLQRGLARVQPPLRHVLNGLKPRQQCTGHGSCTDTRRTTTHPRPLGEVPPGARPIHHHNAVPPSGGGDIGNVLSFQFCDAAAFR